MPDPADPWASTASEPAPPAPTGPTVLAWDVAGNRPVSVPASEFQAQVAAGKIVPTAQSVIRSRTASGDTAVRSPSAGLPVGETQDLGATDAALAAIKAQRDAFNTVGDKGLTFAEGVVDALSLGLIHEHGDAADVRRDVNSGSQLAGELVGTIAGVAAGDNPLANLAKGGASVGETAARGLLGDLGESGLKRIAARGLEEAGVGAALGGAHAIGSGISDAVVDDKPLSAEAILSEAGLNAVLGFGFGAVGGAARELAGKLGGASRGAVEAQGGLLDPKSADSASVADHVNGALNGMDAALDVHEQRLGALRALAADGHIPDDFMQERADAFEAADKARARAREVKVSDALAGDVKTYSTFRDHLDAYQGALSDLDEAMRPREFAGPDSPAVMQVPPDPPPLRDATQNGRAFDAVARGAKTEALARAAGPEVAEAAAATPSELEPFSAPEGPDGPDETPTRAGQPGNRAGQPEVEAPMQVEAPAPPQAEAPAPPSPAPVPADPHAGVSNFLDEWRQRSQQMGPVASPGDVASARIGRTLDAVQAASGGKTDAVAMLNAGRQLGLSRAATPLGDALDQVWSIRKVAQAAADQARGVANPLQDTIKHGVQHWVKHIAAHAVGALAGEDSAGPPEP